MIVQLLPVVNKKANKIDRLRFLLILNWYPPLPIDFFNHFPNLRNIDCSSLRYNPE